MSGSQRKYNTPLGESVMRIYNGKEVVVLEFVRPLQNGEPPHPMTEHRAGRTFTKGEKLITQLVLSYSAYYTLVQLGVHNIKQLNERD
ncbi:hypothetical protein ACKGJO_06880 [Gracilimonas sp. Q87]|uniref:hypothetical protein n=1 Tax=Gracilimonas sp. Q87 TaxID=3384766 RepID=UPI003984163D